MCSLSKIFVTCQGFTQSKWLSWRMHAYSGIVILLYSNLRFLSLKLSSLSHSSKNLIYNSWTEIGVGMESWERMERKKKKEHLFNFKLGKPWQNSQTHILISKLHEMSFISNLNNETNCDKNSFPLPIIQANIPAGTNTPFIKCHIPIITLLKTCKM